MILKILITRAEYEYDVKYDSLKVIMGDKHVFFFGIGLDEWVTFEKASLRKLEIIKWILQERYPFSSSNF